jgi:hypothetical protein
VGATASHPHLLEGAEVGTARFFDMATNLATARRATNRRRVMVRFLCTSAEAALLQRAARQRGLTLSELLRRAGAAYASAVLGRVPGYEREATSHHTDTSEDT